MCGILGYIGKGRKIDFFFDRLKILEYRGYDSAGFAHKFNKEIEIIKKVGNISCLEKTTDKSLICQCAIFHTRWATHGRVDETNAHPHTSFNKKWTIVHNGIIENYDDLKKRLKKKPKSETDTAVLCQVLEERSISKLDDFIDCMNNVTGSFAIVGLMSNSNDNIIFAKRKSPLYVAEKDGDFLFASDLKCFNGFSDKCYILNDDEFGFVENNKIVIKDKNKKIVNKKYKKIDTFFKDKSDIFCQHYMLKEIYEIPEKMREIAKKYKINHILYNFCKNNTSFDDIILIGCGTAYHACLMGEKIFQKILKINSRAIQASEFIYSKPIIANKNSLFIFLTQSGETADTLSAVCEAKKIGATTIAITNVTYSTITKMVDYVFPLFAGEEISVASTKVYVNMVLAIYLFCNYLSNRKNHKKCQYFKKIMNLSYKVLSFDKKIIEKFSDDFVKIKEAIFIGKDIDYVTSLEASLKLKEVAYVNVSCYPSGELKHGFLALVKKNLPLMVFAGNKDINCKTFNSAKEAASRGAKIYVLSNEEILKKNLLKIENDDPILNAISFIVPMQYFAYLVSIKKEINPDQPKNLAKSVTVE